jgi:NAD-binding of NADP-dependent 3-hydroxyisobutyrate dehydrogenase
VHGERLLKRNFAPGFRIELHQKDLSLALESAKTLGVSLPHTATCQKLFNACVANGLGRSDHSAVVRALELMANFTVGGVAEKLLRKWARAREDSAAPTELSRVLALYPGLRPGLRTVATSWLETAGGHVVAESAGGYVVAIHM